MKRFDYDKFKNELRKTCDKMYKERDEIAQQRIDLESDKEENHDNIVLLKAEECFIVTLTNSLEEAINSIESFWDE